MFDPLFALILLPLAALTLAVFMSVHRHDGFRPSGHFPILELYSRDLTKLALEKSVDPVIGREREIARLAQILSRRTKNNPVLIGESGVGKTAIVEGLAQLIIEKKVPVSLLGKRVLQLDLGSLVAGTKYRGEFERRLKGLTDELINSQRQVILFIDELHTLAEAGEATGAIDAANILKPPLARGELQVIGATTPIEYQQYIEKDHTLERRFQPIFIEEPTADETLAILYGLRSKYEEYHDVKITDKALAAAVDLSDACASDRVFPDKAIDLIDEACAYATIRRVKSKKRASPSVSEKEIKKIVSQWGKNHLIVHKKKK